MPEQSRIQGSDVHLNLSVIMSAGSIWRAEKAASMII